MKNSNAVLKLPTNRISELPFSSLNCEEKDFLIENALSILADKHMKGSDILCSPRDTHAFLRIQLAEQRNEVFGVLFLDNKHRLISNEILFNGTIDGTSVYPRVIAMHCLDKNSAAIVIYHNHPSGDCKPSRADKSITSRIKESLALLDVRLLDHIIVSSSESFSFAEQGLL